MINQQALIDLALSTAVFNSYYDRETKPWEIDHQEAWSCIAETATQYLEVAGVDTSAIQIDKYSISATLWGMTREQVDAYFEDEDEEE